MRCCLTREGMIWFWDHYAPDPAQRSEPGASPLRTPDFSGLATCRDSNGGTTTCYVTKAKHTRSDSPTRACRSTCIATRDRSMASSYYRCCRGSELGFQQVVKAIRAAHRAPTNDQ